MLGTGAGMNRETGRWVRGWEHTSQSIGDIVSTPLLTRVMRRPYGASEDALVDKPVNRWEPRARLRRVVVASADVTGKLGLRMTAVYMPRALVGDMTPAGEGDVAA